MPPSSRSALIPWVHADDTPSRHPSACSSGSLAARDAAVAGFDDCSGSTSVADFSKLGPSSLTIWSVYCCSFAGIMRHGSRVWLLLELVARGG